MEKTITLEHLKALRHKGKEILATCDSREQAMDQLPDLYMRMAIDMTIYLVNEVVNTVGVSSFDAPFMAASFLTVAELLTNVTNYKADSEREKANVDLIRNISNEVFDKAVTGFISMKEGTDHV